MQPNDFISFVKDMFSLKFNLLSKNIPKCNWKEVYSAVFWLKIKGGWLNIYTLQEKNTSCACLAGSGLTFISVGMLIHLSFKVVVQIDTRHQHIQLQRKVKCRQLTIWHVTLNFQINRWYRFEDIVVDELKLGKFQLPR